MCVWLVVVWKPAVQRRAITVMAGRDWPPCCLLDATPYHRRETGGLVMTAPTSANGTGPGGYYAAGRAGNSDQTSLMQGTHGAWSIGRP